MLSPFPLERRRAESRLLSPSPLERRRLLVNECACPPATFFFVSARAKARVILTMPSEMPSMLPARGSLTGLGWRESSSLASMCSWIGLGLGVGLGLGFGLGLGLGLALEQLLRLDVQLLGARSGRGRGWGWG